MIGGRSMGMGNKDKAKDELSATRNSATFECAGFQVHSWREGVSAFADMKEPEASQTSNDTKYFA
jgi:hypothetical protein